jgi:hypothetical protein
MKYKFHNENSRIGWMHFAYDVYGPKAAKQLGAKLGLSEVTLTVQLLAWQKGNEAIRCYGYPTEED